MATTRRLTISAANATLHTPAWKPSGAGLRGCLVAHGHGGDDTQARQGFYFAGHCEQLADRGYAVLAMSLGDTWANSAGAMAGLTNGYTYLTGTIGISGTKVCGIGSSMGGLNLLRWMAENPTLVNAMMLFSPVSDLDWAETQGAWTTEIDALYGGTHANYLTQGSPRSPAASPASYRAGAYVQIVHPTDDGTVPSSQSTSFVSAVNDARVTMRTPDVTGGHTGGQTAVLPRESWEFIRTHWS